MKKITLSNLRAKKGARNHKLKTRGRGPGSGSIRGFKGNKGQGQRITGSVRAGFEGGQTPLYRRVRIIGFNNYEFANNYNVITLNMILKNKKNDFKNELNPTTLLPLIRNKK
jgi:large subunit ribosomal protein L15